MRILRKMKAFLCQLHSNDSLGVVLVVGQACNLKCINCGNFCPKSTSNTKHYSLNSILRSLEILLKNISSMSLHIQGGEPFLYSDLEKLLVYTKAQRKIKTVEIATNGEIMPSEGILKTIQQNNKVSIRISNYCISDNPDKLTCKLDNTGIKYYYYSFASGNNLWHDLGPIDIKPFDEKQAEKNFWNCAFNTCLTLENGELTYCSRAANSYRLQHYQRKDNDYLKVEDRPGFSKELKQFIANKHPMEACRYCNGTSGANLIKAAQQP